MLRISTCAIFAMLSFSSHAQSISLERQVKMIPFLAQDRERAMNDGALCKADLDIMSRNLGETQSKLDAANKKVDDLSKKIDDLIKATP